MLTAILPLELNLIILGYSDGCIRQTSLVQLARGGFSTKTLTFDKVSDGGIQNSYVQSLHLVRNDRTKERFVVGGGDDGGIAVWALGTLQLRARWTIFLRPLQRVIQLHNEKVGPLRGCALCISGDGTIAVIVIDGFDLLYLIPGAASPLKSICLGGENLLLIYADDSARLWDAKTREFWRSMGADKAGEMTGQGGWMTISMEGRDQQTSTSISSLSNGARSTDSLCTLTLDLERFLKYTAVVVKSINPTESPATTLTQLRAVLSILLTPGLNDDIDNTCHEQLGLEFSSATVGYTRASSTVLFNLETPRDAWCISGEISGARALALTAILKTLSLHEEVHDDCQTVITFYATSLADVVGSSYMPPDLVYLAQRWFDSSNEIRQAARILFDAGVVRLPDEESIALVDAWQHYLPCLQPTVDKDSTQAALALFLCGYMTGEKYSLMSTTALIDISKSIALYLHDDHSAHRGLAIDLCSRGFQIWQHYVDAMEMLRALCVLATSARKENISTQNVGPQARLAVLQIASSNTPLFMTTLTLDILNPKNLEHRKSVMQLVAFLIRKKPLILYPNLPRLMEAVVKSLDPNSSANRDAVLDTATEILGHVVKTFPTIDFHMATQRLAVGTSEGVFIMYDLKTATQMYVLEGHKKRPAACTFSPDGRRLVTVSLEEGVVLVWKVGSSFSSFFKPGAPPRQGHSGSQPFKTLAFNVGAEANMTIVETLEYVRFEWPAERSVRLHIRESVLTFST
ncbi:WD40-repeat-containing domain protein [Hygrophoropsis aurantiaca]|uniref:WD40-repeat-containing domain protein n=1 Tax=Hygrophoropsis aurantiaca TaxID=72124 RepID=A0ACB8A903_9AGAM|nr:WD40-repeat-containing domain protein [Hygrophoropsis aurantiaca]